MKLKITLLCASLCTGIHLAPAPKITVVEESLSQKLHQYFLSIKGAYEHVSGSHAKATRTYSDLTSITNNDETLKQSHIKLAFDSGHYQEVVTHYNYLTHLTPPPKDLLFILAQSYFFTQQEEKALEIFSRLMQTYPNDDRFSYFAAITYIKQNQSSQALALINKSLTQPLFHEKHYLFHYLKARLALTTEDITTARSEIAACLTQNPSFAQGFLLRATIEDKEGHYQKALEDFERYFIIHPADPQTVPKIIQLSIKTKNYPRAQSLLTAYPATTMHYFHDKTLLHLAHKQYSDAAKTIAEGSKIYPSASVFKELQITLLVSQGKFKELSQIITSWLSQDPTNRPLIKRVLKLRKNKMPYRILQKLLSHAAQEKQTWQLCFALGDLVHEQHKYAEARKWYRIALNDTMLPPMQLIASQLYYQIAGSYYSQKKYPKAAAANNNALACKPHCPEADMLISELAQVLKVAPDMPTE